MINKIAVIILFSLALFTTGLYSQTGWTVLPTGSTSYLTAVYFTDAATGFIGGQSGYMAKTTSGGTNWTVLNSGMSGFVRKIYFADANTGYSCGDNGSIGKTTNGGINWNALNSGITATIYSIAATDVNTVYFSTNLGTVLKTTNGGLNFNSITVTTTGLFAIDFPGTDIGFTAGLSGKVYKTTNAGANWTELISYTVNNIYDIEFINNNTGWFATYYNTIRNTLNGKDFVPKMSGTINYEDINPIDERIIYTFGLNGLISKSFDGGKSWIPLVSGTSQGLTEAFFLNANTGYAVGSSGTVLKTTDGGGLNYAVTLLSPFGGEVLLSGSTHKIKWGSLGISNLKIEYTTNSGTSWNIISNSAPATNYSYDWNVPTVVSADCRVRVSDAGNSSMSDISNRNFYIVNTLNGFTAPDILYLKFNNGSTTTPNYAAPGEGDTIAGVTGHSIQNGGMFDSCLVGAGGTGATNYVTNNFPTYLPNSGWTIGFWVSSISLGTTATNPVYIFGDGSVNNFRCYYGGSGGIGATDTAIMLRMTGAADVRIPVIKGNSYYIHIVWDSAAGAIKTYRNGVFYNSTPQTSYIAVGNGPLLIGGHSTLASSLALNMKLDEFRIYGRTLGASEIAGTWNVSLPYNIITFVTKFTNEFPAAYKLYQNYPNPFNSMTNIRFDIPFNQLFQSVSGGESGHVSLKVYDILGKEIVTLVNEKLNAGTYSVRFDAGDLPGGVYFYRLVSGNYIETKKLLLLK